MSLQKNIKDLIYFYVRENYNIYLKENNIIFIPEEKLDDVINHIYSQRKEHLKEFVKSSIKRLSKPDEYPGDQTITNILLNIFNDDDICKNRLKIEIKLHQQSKQSQTTNYSNLLSNK
jgi:hypothetical protein